MAPDARGVDLGPPKGLQLDNSGGGSADGPTFPQIGPTVLPGSSPSSASCLNCVRSSGPLRFRRRGPGFRKQINWGSVGGKGPAKCGVTNWPICGRAGPSAELPPRVDHLRSQSRRGGGSAPAETQLGLAPDLLAPRFDECNPVFILGGSCGDPRIPDETEVVSN